MSKTYLVSGMTCGGCSKSLSAALAKAAPDAKFTVDHASSKVVVEGAVPGELVKSVVETAGFDFLGEADAG